MKNLKQNTVRHTLPLAPCTVIKMMQWDSNNLIKAHEATGHTLMREHVEKMHRAVNTAIQTDERFNKPASNGTNPGYQPKPYCLDITTPDDKGCHHAIISKANGELVRHGFDFDHDLGTCKMADGESCPTERSVVYARELERHENMMRASQELISCRASNGLQLQATEKWESSKAVSYIYAPGGITTINAGFRAKNTITCTVAVDEDTPKDLQESFDHLCSTNKGDPFADEDHKSSDGSTKATLIYPAGKVKFIYGKIRGEEGVIVQGAEPTSYGAESVNGKVYRSWSPEFATDADYSKAIEKKGHFSFPEGVRGSATNPARLIAVGFVTGALTNKPAFKNMPPVKAKAAEVEGTDAMQADTVQATWSDAAARASSNLANKVGGQESHLNAMAAHTNAAETIARIHSGGLKDEHKKAIGYHLASATDHHARAFSKSHVEATDATAADTVQAAAEAGADLVKTTWSDAAREAASEARKHSFHSEHSSGGSESHDSEKSAIDWHRKKHPKAEFGDWEHAGENRERKLVWKSSKDAENDDGRKSVSQIIRRKLETTQATDRVTTGPLADIIARQAADAEWLNQFAMKSPIVRAQVEAANKKPDEVVSNLIARQQDARDFEARLLAKNPAAANHDLLKKLEAQTI